MLPRGNLNCIAAFKIEKKAQIIKGAQSLTF
jgi:hypothetical protein